MHLRVTLLFLPGVIDRPCFDPLPFGTERPVIQLPAAAFKRVLIYLDLIRTETREQAAGNELVLRSLVQSLATICRASGNATGRERLCVWKSVGRPLHAPRAATLRGSQAGGGLCGLAAHQPEAPHRCFVRNIPGNTPLNIILRPSCRGGSKAPVSY